jgi:type IV pilus biogenesis protein CpaD/CtpE
MNKKLKIFLLISVGVLFVIVAVVLHRVFIEFKNSKVRSYIMEEANKYSNPASATVIINEGVKNILASRTLTREVREYAKATGTEKEKVLVTGAVMQAKSYGYLA